MSFRPLYVHPSSLWPRPAGISMTSFSKGGSFVPHCNSFLSLSTRRRAGHRAARLELGSDESVMSEREGGLQNVQGKAGR